MPWSKWVRVVGHLALLGWEPLRLDGDYAWPSEPLKEEFRPLRNPRSVFLNAAQRMFWNRFCNDPVIEALLTQDLSRIRSERRKFKTRSVR